MHATRRHLLPLIALIGTSLIAAGCGGGDGGDTESDVTPERRVELCLEQQPDATERDCQGWEEAGEITDDGTHVDHQDMG